MLYIIDGYNLLFSVADPDPGFEKKRESLVRKLASQFSLTKMQLMIVFDAYQIEEESRRTHYRQIELVYTAKGETADQWIVAEVERKKHPGNVTVVTSDRDLAWRCRRSGAKTEDVQSFIQRFRSKIPVQIKKKTQFKEQTPEKKEKKPLDKNEARYLELFEKRLEESGYKVEKTASNFERWLKIFEERLEENEQN